MVDENIIKQVIKKVAEEFAFMFAEEEDETDYWLYNEHVKAEMGFSGEAEGVIIIIAPEELCRNMACNVLGIDNEEEIDLSSEDALCEFLNIFCGNLLTEVYGENAVFDLYPPKAEKIQLAELENLLGKEDFISILIDDFPSFIIVRIKSN